MKEDSGARLAGGTPPAPPLREVREFREFREFLRELRGREARSIPPVGKAQVFLGAAVLLLGACAQSPPPVTRNGGAGGASPAATSAATAPAAPASGVPATPPRSSEAETKAGAVPAAAATSAPPTPTTPPPPLVTSNAAGAGAGAAGAPAGPARPAPGAPAAAGLVVPIDSAAGAKADPSVVVVEPADPDPDSTLSLVDAAKAERERKAEAPPPRISINNKNLHTYAKGGQLTIAEPKKKGSATGGATAAAAPAGTAGATGTGGAAGGAAGSGEVAPLVRDEKYWRGRALEIRQRWRKAADRIEQLQGDINLWRRRFYAEDDPYVRDGQIKPAWDRALDELREDREAVTAAKKELEDFMDEGRRAGALPGWLREGIELEPKDEKPVDPLQPIETPIYKPDHGPDHGQ